MRFYLIRESGGRGARARLTDDAGGGLMDVVTAEDEVIGWYEGLRQTRLSAAKLRALLDRPDQFRRCVCDVKDSRAFWRFKCALLRYLQVVNPATVGASETKIRDAQRVLYGTLTGHFNFHAAGGGQHYTYALVVSGKKILWGRPQMMDYSPDCVPQEVWAVSLRKLLAERGEAKVRELLVSHRLLANVARNSLLADGAGTEEHEFTWRSFLSFSKTLVRFVDQHEGLVNLQYLLPSICALIVEHEYDSADDQRRYLQRLLQYDETPHNKLARLNQIVRRVNGAALDDQARHGPRLASIVGTISTHYLRQYDLNTAVHFWRIIDERERDWVLRSLLSVYYAPGVYAAAAAVFMTTLSALTALGPRAATQTLSEWGAATWLPWLMITAVYGIGLLGLYWIVRRFFVPPRRGLEYIELTLPSMLGTIVVGLSALLLQDYAWKLGLGLTGLGLLLTSLTVYALSFIYIFIDVHKTIRFSPPHPQSGGRAGFSLAAWAAEYVGPLRRRLSSERAQTMKRSIGVSYKIFLIGLLEAFIAVLLTTTLFGRALMTDQIHDELLGLVAKGDLLLFEYDMPGLGTLTFFPGLVLLWTGLTLFIGAFAQLVWQDRGITSPPQ